MNLLITGFEPFQNEEQNASYEAVKVLPDIIAGYHVIKAQIPTEFNHAWRCVEHLMQTYRPRIVVCVGQAGGRSQITPEFVAINYRDARIKDNAGLQPHRESIIPGKPNAYFSSLPVYDIVENLRSSGIPASVSYSAGTYVCNEVFYSLMHTIHDMDEVVIGGFIHVPYTLEQVVDKPGIAGIAKDKIALGLKRSIETMCESIQK